MTSAAFTSGCADATRPHTDTGPYLSRGRAFIGSGPLADYPGSTASGGLARMCRRTTGRVPVGHAR
jgi:hypothetical protein